MVYAANNVMLYNDTKDFLYICAHRYLATSSSVKSCRAQDEHQIKVEAK